jgi:hypothetical protein
MTRIVASPRKVCARTIDSPFSVGSEMLHRPRSMRRTFVWRGGSRHSARSHTSRFYKYRYELSLSAWGTLRIGVPGKTDTEGRTLGRYSMKLYRQYCIGTVQNYVDARQHREEPSRRPPRVRRVGKHYSVPRPRSAQSTQHNIKGAP